MGELSKKIGEQGEELVMRFFKQIGWTPLADGIDIECEFPEKHKRKAADATRATHGVDLMFSYHNHPIEKQDG